MRPEIACVFGVLALTGCGAARSAENEPPSLEDVAAATRAQAYRFELTMKGDGLEESFRATATGAADPADERASMRYVFDDGGDAELTVDVRRVGRKTYTRTIAPDFDGGWAEARDGEAGLALPFGAFSEPHRALDALVRHGGDVETSTGEEIDGVPVVGYRTTVPLIELFGADLKAEERKELEADIRETGSDTAEVDVWADVDGVLRKLAFTVSIREDGREGRLESTTRFFDFGKPVHVEAPAPSELDDRVSEQDYGSATPGPCKGAASPHSPQEVLDVLRAGGFQAQATCVLGRTQIWAQSTRDRDIVVWCAVRRSVDSSSNVPREELGQPVVLGNVTCVAPAQAIAQRVRTALGRL